MKFKATYARVVEELQKVEVIIEAANLEERDAKFEVGDFSRFLVAKRELREVTPVGEPTFEKVA